MARGDWRRAGRLDDGSVVDAALAGPSAHGVIAAHRQPADGPLAERVAARETDLVRVTPTATEVVWRGPGTVVALDVDGARWVAAVATLRPSGEGSIYRLVRSDDAAATWHDAGDVPALSVLNVLLVGADEVWAHGARTLLVSADGGASWSTVDADRRGNAHRERLRRHGGGAALLGEDGFARTEDRGATWRRTSTPGACVVDLVDNHLLAVWADGRSGQAALGAAAPDDPLPDGRLPLRLVRHGDVTRILSRAADGARGPDVRIHRRTGARGGWHHESTRLSAHVDIAGPDWGLGTDHAGAVFVTGEA